MWHQYLFVRRGSAISQQVYFKYSMKVEIVLNFVMKNQRKRASYIISSIHYLIELYLPRKGFQLIFFFELIELDAEKRIWSNSSSYIFSQQVYISTEALQRALC